MISANHAEEQETQDKNSCNTFCLSSAPTELRAMFLLRTLSNEEGQSGKFSQSFIPLSLPLKTKLKTRETHSTEDLNK
jgi:hypothetical protein